MGGTFHGLARILEAIDDDVRERVGVCFDTCHAYAAGYDLVEEYDAVWEKFDRVVGLDRLRLFHLNDSLHPLDSHKDRHADIGAGTLGEEPFRRLMRDARFRDVPKVLETPKGDDPPTASGATGWRTGRDPDREAALRPVDSGHPVVPNGRGVTFSVRVLEGSFIEPTHVKSGLTSCVAATPR